MKTHRVAMAGVGGFAPGVGGAAARGVPRSSMGVHRALVSYARRRIVAEVRNPKLSRDMRAQGRSALAALERGLGGHLWSDRGSSALQPLKLAQPGRLYGAVGTTVSGPSLAGNAPVSNTGRGRRST